MNWHIISGEYPPQKGGVSDYTQRVARGLAGAGDEVHVWVPACAGGRPGDCGVTIHELPGHFGASALWHLHRELRRYPAQSRILVQYVPHAYGWKAMNVALCAWVYWMRDRAVWVMFHEVSVPTGRAESLKNNFLGMVHRLMAMTIMASARRVFVTIPTWEVRLASWARNSMKIECLPVPSSIPRITDPEGVAAVRNKLLGSERYLLGHFGTYRAENAELLFKIAPGILSRCPGRLLLIGQNSTEFTSELQARNPAIAHRIVATGGLDAAGVSRHLSACDLMIQPYPDGVSGRRTSITASLAHGRPVVTNQGSCTEDFWAESDAVLMGANLEELAGLTEALLHDGQERQRLSEIALGFYKQRFRNSQIISTLRTSTDSEPGRRSTVNA